MSSSPVGLPSPERVPMTREDVSRLSDEELAALAGIVSEESEKRERESARFAEGLKARATKRDPRRPECAAKLWRDGTHAHNLLVKESGLEDDWRKFDVCAVDAREVLKDLL